MSDYTYRVGFIFAIALHILLVFFLFVKFTTTRPMALKSANTFINATTVSEHELNNRAVAKFPPNILQKPKEEVVKPVLPEQVTKPQPVISNTKPQIKQQIKDALQKNLLMEQSREVAELKREKQKYQKNIAKMEQQQKMQKLLQEQAKAEQKELVDEQAAANAESQGEVDKYAVMVKQAVSSQWIKPDGVDVNAFVWLSVTVAPGGVVLNIQVSSSSGNAALDRSAQVAVSKASPLPVPEDSVLFDRFREIKLKFNSQGVIGG